MKKTMRESRHSATMHVLDRRQMLGGLAAYAAMAAAGLMPGRATYAADGDADLVIRNGRVLLIDKGFQQAEAIAIRDGRVLAVGSDRDIRRNITSRTRQIDAGGGTVLPGINDTHYHLNVVGLNRPPYMLDVNKKSVAELVGAVRTAAEQAKSDSWIRGGGWQELVMPRIATAADLDPVSGNHPVVLRDFSGHAMVVNSVVLRMAGITRNTVTPVGGVIDKDAKGEPTGVLRETAMRLVQQHVPPYTNEELSAAIDEGVRIAQSKGMTSVTEPGIDLRTFGIYADKARNGALSLRVTALLSARGGPDTLREVIANYRPPTGVDANILRAIGVKLGADGIPRFRTAWMNKPYLDGTRGSMTVAGATVDEQIANLHKMIQMAADAGLQVGTHACGDAATDAAVAGYVKAIEKSGGRSELRHCIHHCNFPSAATLKTMARYGIGANLNAEILYLQGRVLESVIGPELTEYQWPYRSALDAGIKVTSGSDAPVVDDNHWLQGVMAAAVREGRDGGVAGKAECITVPEALATYTSTGAWQDRAESWKGTLEPGKAADICIVDADLLHDDPRSFPKKDVTTTILGGRVVYEQPQGRASAALGNRKRGHEHTGQCCCTFAEQFNGGANDLEKQLT
jgi:predicted amidohydrolase YtcJ